MVEIEVPPLQRRIFAELKTCPGSPKLERNVYRLRNGPGLAKILTRRGWRIENETKDYLNAEAPASDFGDDPLIIEINVPTREQVLSLARQVHTHAPDRPWGQMWGEWGAVYCPQTEWTGTDVAPFTRERGEIERDGLSGAWFKCGVSGLFESGVDDLGGADRDWEKVELVSPPAPTLFEKQGSVLIDDVATSSRLFEGSPTEVRLTHYERSQAARRACIAHWGLSCCVCGFVFEAVYGQHGTDYIQVHHILPLAEIGERYEVDPVNDLRPVCPNCHAMLHRKETAMTIEKLRRIVEEKAQS